jgi:Glycosyl transferase family 2
MTASPLLRARHIRWRLLRLLDDARAARSSAEESALGVREIRAAMEQSRAQTTAMAAALTRMEADLQVAHRRQRELAGVLEVTRSELQAQGRVLELMYEEEAENVQRLNELRGSPEYRRAFSEEDALVSVIIPTYTHYETLMQRAVPSVLAQTYPHIEVVVVGDGAPQETAKAVAALGDPRVRYENLTVRAPYPDDPSEFWRVAGTPPWNRAWALAEGSWIAPLNDDDAFRPDHIEKLLAAAREQSYEVAYGAIEHHHPDGTAVTENSWPPESHHFGWQAAIVHAGLGFMPMQLGSGALGVPGDWSLCRRMRRAGVRFVKLDDVVVDYYPSGLWATAEPSRAHGARWG